MFKRSLKTSLVSIFGTVFIFLTTGLAPIVAEDIPVELSREFLRFSRVPTGSSQIILVKGKSSPRHQVEIRLYVRTARGWKSILGSIPGVAGRNGFVRAAAKTEGDNRTPLGIYTTGAAFGHHNNIDTKLDYRPTDNSDFWISDPDDPNYNLWVRSIGEAKSYINLGGSDRTYKYGMVINFNNNPVVKNRGSAIFFHVWKSASSPTSGGVALSEVNLKKLLSHLNRKKNPIVILSDHH